MDPSKACNCLSNDFLIAELKDYDIDNLLSIYRHSVASKQLFSFHKQKKEIDSPFSDWVELISGISQGSVLDLLHFKVIINEIFYKVFVGLKSTCLKKTQQNFNSSS